MVVAEKDKDQSCQRPCTVTAGTKNGCEINCLGLPVPTLSVALETVRSTSQLKSPPSSNSPLSVRSSTEAMNTPMRPRSQSAYTLSPGPSRSVKPMNPGHHEYPAAFRLAGETTVFQNHELCAVRSERVRTRSDEVQNKNIRHSNNQRFTLPIVGKSNKRTDHVAQSFVLPFRRVPQCESKTIFRLFEFNLPPVVKANRRASGPDKAGSNRSCRDWARRMSRWG